MIAQWTSQPWAQGIEHVPALPHPFCECNWLCSSTLIRAVVKKEQKEALKDVPLSFIWEIKKNHTGALAPEKCAAAPRYLAVGKECLQVHSGNVIAPEQAEKNRRGNKSTSKALRLLFKIACGSTEIFEEFILKLIQAKINKGIPLKGRLIKEHLEECGIVCLECFIHKILSTGKCFWKVKNFLFAFHL